MNSSFHKCTFPFTTPWQQKIMQVVLELHEEFAYLLSENGRDTLNKAITHLENKINSLLEKCFIVRIHQLKKQRILQGDSPEGRFNNFIKRLNTEEEVTALHQMFPVLFTLIDTLIENFHQALSKFFLRFAADRHKMAEYFNIKTVKNLQISELMPGLGDPHHGGETVIKLICNGSHTFYYKPRSLSADVFIQRVISHLCQRTKKMPSLVLPRTLACDSYGWQEAVTFDPSNIRDIDHYYFTLGHWLGLFYFLGSVDMHYENLIVSHGQPVFIDLETITQPRLNYRDPGEDAYSILNTMIPPQIGFSTGLRSGVDLSAIGFKGDVIFPDKKEFVVNPFSDEIHIGTGFVKMPYARNLPAVDPENFFPLAYLAPLQAGFGNMSEILISEASQIFSAASPLAECFHAEIRILLRPTHSYAKLYSRGNHPYALSSENARVDYFRQIKKSSYGSTLPEQLVDLEIKALYKGDIPKFTSFINSRDLYFEGHVIAKNFFDASALTVLQQRVFSLQEEIPLQMKILQRAYATSALNNAHSHIADTATAELVNPDISSAARHEGDAAHVQALAIKVCEAILKNILSFCQVKNGFLHGWGPAKLNHTDWSFQALTMDFYGGLSGVMLTLAAAARRLASNHAYEYALAAYQTVYETLEFDRRAMLKMPVGYSGFAGMLMAANITEEQLGIEANLSQGLYALLPEKLEDSKNSMDFLDGIAGLVSVLMAYCRKPPDSLKYLERCLDLLNQQYDASSCWWPHKHFPNPVLGLSHGYSGYAYALSLAAKFLKQPSWLQQAERLINLEDGYFDANSQRWPDLRIKPLDYEDAHTLHAWCHGSTGILLARSSMYQITQENVFLQKTETALTNTIRAFGSDNMSCCHGDIGRLEAMFIARDQLGEALFQDKLRDLLIRMEKGVVSGLPENIETPGFMAGSAGILYHLLRFITPNCLPAVLLPFPADAIP